MTRQRPVWQYMLLFLSFLSLSLAASPTSFCKCTCFTNSTIIPLDAPPSSDKPTEPDAGTNPTRLTLRDAEPDPLALEARDILPTNGSGNKVHGRTCADCNKQFCLSYNLPICAGATEENVLTTCFQRDSVKDQLVVWIFLIATVGLLAWATVKPWWTRWREGYGAVPG